LIERIDGDKLEQLKRDAVRGNSLVVDHRRS
jgi:hypothetical protein